jgi:hypothetical protein
MGLLSKKVKIIKVKDAAGAATSAVESDGVDMDQDGGFGGVLFVTSFGTAAANNTINAAQSDDDGSSDDYTDLAGTGVSSGASDEDVWLDVYRPTKRYVRLEAARGTSSTLGDIWAILYEPRVAPTSNVLSGTIVGEGHVSPPEGTA